jgi:thiol reductant ABC exporter CydC subunit
MTLGRLSRSARRALVGCAVLAALGGVAVVVQAWALAAVLTAGGPLGVLAGAVLARALLTWATQVVAARAAAGAKEELRARLLDRALALGPKWTVPRGAELTVLATRGLDALDAYFTVYLPALVNAAVLPLGVGAVLLVADWPSALVVAATVPLVPLFAALVGLRTRDRVRAAAVTEQRVARHLRELVRVRPVLTAFRRAAAQAETIRRISDTQRRSTMATLRVAFASSLVLELVATLSVALVAVLVGMRLVNGDLSLAVGLFVLILAPECYLPLRAAGAAHHASEAGLETVRAIAALPTPRVSGTQAPCGNLRVTAPLPFTARPGEIVHLNTPSASGKSRTFAAVLGFAEGRVQVGETDLSEVDIEAWRRMVAWVPQHPKFAGGTVAEELGGEPAPELGITHLLDRAVDQLSTGERQRVAMARALRRDAKVLLLDEPTAHLDPANAAAVTALVEQAAAHGAAVVLASHRTAQPTEPTARPSVTTTVTRERHRRLPLHTLLTPRLLAGAALGAAALVAGVALTATSAWLIAKAATQPSIMTLGVAVVGVRAFGLARAGLRYAERLVTHDAAFRMAAAERVRVWRTAAYERLTTDVDTVRDLTPRVLLPPIVAALVCVAAVVVQWAILPAAGAALTIAIVVAGLGAPAVALAVDRRATRALSAGRRTVATQVLTLLDAAPDLIAFGTHHVHRAAIARADAELAGKARRQALSAGAAGALITLAMGAATVASVWLAAGAVDPLLLPVLALVPLALTETLTTLPPAAQHLAPLRAAHTTPQAPCLPVHEPVPAAVATLRHVDVRWPGANAPTIRDLSIDIPAGTHLAVIGPSGVGKSTLLALLCGLLPAERGTVRLPRAAWCPQEPHLAATSLRENLRVGDPTATDDQLRAALRAAALDTWTDRLDDDPTTASGGEAQRVAIARALLADADLLLLDEPTAHLDVPTADRIFANLKGRTVVHVTHRPDEAASADAVLDLT